MCEGVWVLYVRRCVGMDEEWWCMCCEWGCRVPKVIMYVIFSPLLQNIDTFRRS